MIKLILIRKNVRKRRKVWALSMHLNLTVYLLNNAVVYSKELHLQTKYIDIIYLNSNIHHYTFPGAAKLNNIIINFDILSIIAKVALYKCTEQLPSLSDIRAISNLLFNHPYSYTYDSPNKIQIRLTKKKTQLFYIIFFALIK